eukprot:m.46033 g.46033  ORF g.46033 m.46033 type:complete len:83 (-) comp12218_c0_seq1:600-848(-)
MCCIPDFRLSPSTPHVVHQHAVCHSSLLGLYVFLFHSVIDSSITSSHSFFYLFFLSFFLTLFVCLYVSVFHSSNHSFIISSH